ncbi:hypothetical protein D3C87_1243300 [compost metagenome]
MADFKVNINEIVKVRLTKRGMDVLRARHEELNDTIKARGGKELEEFNQKIDEDGYSKFQMWDLMNTFGIYMFAGTDLPFATEIIVSNGTHIDCEHEKEYENFILTSNPPQYPWKCKKCGVKGADK